MSTRHYDYLVKLILIGDSGVGKSSILARFSDDNFSQSFISTIGIDFKIRTIEINSYKVKLQVWDTAGQERFATITTAYYRGAQGIILVYDITNVKSFENCQKWKKNIDNHSSENTNMVLCGNKLDMASKRVVSREDGQKYADDNKMDYIETSAKDNINIDNIFYKIAKDIINKMGEFKNKKPEPSNRKPTTNDAQESNIQIRIRYICDVF